MPHRYAPDDPLHPEQLKSKQRELRDGFPLPLTLRVHRSISWLRRAEQEEDDLDVLFVLLWIGFNAAYAGDLDRAVEGTSANASNSSLPRSSAWTAPTASMTRSGSGSPMKFACCSTTSSSSRPSGSIRRANSAGWEVSFDAAKRAANRALAEKNTAVVLSILFDRLYVLRNQIIHGGATWDSSANRNQVRDGAALLGCLLPVFIDLMMDHPDAEWTMPMYPVVEG